jgi:hexulose-6-phosphate isomerase
MAKAQTANTAQINYWTIGGFEGNKPPIQAIQEARAMGFEGMELAFGAGHLAPGVSQAACEKIRAAAQDMGMKLETLSSGNYWGLSLSHPKAEVRDKAVAFTKEYMQVAKWLGAKTVLVVPGAVCVPWDPSQPVVPYAQVWKLSTASIRKLLPTASKLGINIGIENVWNWFLTDPMAFKAFIDQFKNPRVGAFFDVGNYVIMSRSEDWIEILGRRIKAVHFKNFQRTDGAGGIHGFGDDLMVGDVNWPAVLTALKKVKYTGPFTAEMIPFSRGDKMVLPDMDLARSTAGRMKEILGRK